MNLQSHTTQFFLTFLVLTLAGFISPVVYLLALIIGAVAMASSLEQNLSHLAIFSGFVAAKVLAIFLSIITPSSAVINILIVGAILQITGGRLYAEFKSFTKSKK